MSASQVREGMSGEGVDTAAFGRMRQLESLLLVS